MIGDPTQHTNETTDELRARRGRGVALPGQRRPWANWVIGFCGAALFLNALIGQSGYFETRRLTQQFNVEQAKLRAMRAENQRLKAYASALKSDPAAIEDLARRTLGLMRPGEIVFIVSDAPPDRRAPAPGQPLHAPGNSPTTR
jgi:cell division protein FtsB